MPAFRLHNAQRQRLRSICVSGRIGAFDMKKIRPSSDARPGLLQIGEHGVAGVLRQWKSRLPAPLAANG